MKAYVETEWKCLTEPDEKQDWFLLEGIEIDGKKNIS